MMLAKRLLALILAAAILFVTSACVDAGEGDDEDAFHKYLARIYILSPTGMRRGSIKAFNPPDDMESNEIEKKIAYDKYCYIAFRVTIPSLVVEDFAFYARTEKGEGTLELDFYISDTLPTKIKVNGDSDYAYMPKVEEQAETDVPETSEGEMTDTTAVTTAWDGSIDEDGSLYVHETDDSSSRVERENEVDESMFLNPAYAHVSFPVTEEWDSVYLEFPRPQIVTEGQYIIIRIRNNCIINLPDPETGLPVDNGAPCKFTFNYLLFHFTNVQT